MESIVQTLQAEDARPILPFFRTPAIRTATDAGTSFTFPHLPNVTADALPDGSLQISTSQGHVKVLLTYYDTSVKPTQTLLDPEHPTVRYVITPPFDAVIIPLVDGHASFFRHAALIFDYSYPDGK